MAGSTPILARPLTSTRLRFSLGVWLGLFILSGLLYALTASRGVQWQDSGYHILRVIKGEVANPLGLALSHPLHHWLGRCAMALGIFEPCFAITLVSALAGALGVANVYGAAVTLTDRHGAALFAAASLAVANTYWQLSTVAETYTLCAALLAAECWALAGFVRTSRNSWLYMMALCNGLGIANHMLASLTVPILVMVVMTRLSRRQRPLRPALIAGGLWLTGTLPYTILILQTWYRTGDLFGTVHSALFGEYAGNVLNTGITLKQLAMTLAFPVYNFPNLLLPAAVYGWWTWRTAGVARASARALQAGLVFHVLFVMRYSIADQQTFFLPTYVLLSIFGGVGAATLMSQPRPVRRMKYIAAAVVLLLLTPVVYAFAPTVARSYKVIERTVGLRHKPYRDDYEYIFTPWSIVETSAEQMSQKAIDDAGEKGLILVEDPMAAFAIEYKIMREGSPDVLAFQLPSKPTLGQRAELYLRIEQAVDRNAAVVLVPMNVDEPSLSISTRLGTWQRRGDLYLLDPSVKPTESSSPTR